MSLSLFDVNADHYQKNCTSQYSQATGILKDVTISPEAEILDVGCGHGTITAELSKRAPYGTTVGIDPSPNMISLASKTFTKPEYPNLQFHQMKAEELNFDKEKFDLAVCLNVFMWIKEPYIAMERISRVLKNNGQFVVFTYSKTTPYVRLFETVVEEYFPEFKTGSAVNTMLSTDEYPSLCSQNSLTIKTFVVQDIVFKYETEDDFKNYIRGWLPCYIPISPDDQEDFLNKIIQKSHSFSIPSSEHAIAIPHQTISLIGTKHS